MEDEIMVVALTGASGAGYGFELVKGLHEAGIKVVIIYNDTALKILKDEHGKCIDDLGMYAHELVHTGQMDHGTASGSNPFHSMVICPCSTSTAGKISAGIADNLTTRCASVALKENRRLVLVVRETPLSTPVLKALHELSSCGVTVMPASPAMYGMPERDLDALISNFTGRVMDVLGVKNELAVRYSPGENR